MVAHSCFITLVDGTELSTLYAVLLVKKVLQPKIHSKIAIILQVTLIYLNAFFFKLLCAFFAVNI